MAKPDQEKQQKPPVDSSESDVSADAADMTADGEASMDPLNQAYFEIADLKSKLVRWQADFQNLQRRAAREVLESRQNADGDFAKSLLNVLDHFDMALSVDPSKVDAKGVLDGMKITHDELKKILANRGIDSYDPTGQPFDYHHLPEGPVPAERSRCDLGDDRADPLDDGKDRDVGSTDRLERPER